MPQAVYILFGSIFTVLTCLAGGTLLLRGLGQKLHRQEEYPLAFLTGAACLSLVVFLLAAVHLIHKGVLLAVGLAVIAFAIRKKVHLPAGEAFPPLPRAWRILFGIVFAVFTVLYFFNAMAPEMSPDGSSYHLGFVSRYYRWHGFHTITTSIYANISQGIEMLFLFAYAFGRHSAAALVHFAFLLALAMAMFAYGRRIGHPIAGAAGALFFYLAPVAGMDATTAYNDVATAAVLFTLFYFLELWDESRDARLLVPIGLLAGFSYASKYTAFIAVPYALAFIGWKLLRARRPMVRPITAVAGLALLMMVPWMVKNRIEVDNPFSPFFNAAFPNPYVHVSFEKDYSAHMRTYDGVTSYAQIPLEVTLRGHLLCGLIGPFFLLAPVALLALRFAAGRQLLLAALVFAAAYPANIGTRFLLPALPFLSLSMALGLAKPQPLLAVLVLAHALSAWPAITKQYCARWAWRLEGIPFKQALRIETEDHYLTRKMNAYLVARMVERDVPPGERVFAFDQVALAYTTRDVLTAYQSAEGQVLGGIQWMPNVREYQPVLNVQFKFAPIELRKVRIVQVADAQPDHWTVCEMRVFHGGKEIARAPEWRLRAWPNIWDVQMAFDNNPVTRWSTWQAATPGNYLEIDFGRNETVDQILLQSSADQYKVKLRFDGLGPDGNWLRFGEQPTETGVATPPRLRALAAREMYRRGIRYLLVMDGDFGSEDILKNSKLWGVEFVEGVPGARLYKILET